MTNSNIIRLFLLSPFLFIVLSAKGQTGDNAAINKSALTRYWQATVPLTPGDSVRSAYLVDDTLYVFSHEGILYSLDTATGIVRWAEPVVPPHVAIKGPAHLKARDSAGPIAIASQTEISLLDRVTGQQLRQFPLAFMPSTRAIGSEDNLIVAGRDGHVYSFQTNEPHAIGLRQRWVVASGVVTAAPVLFHGNKLLFATHSGRVFACTANDKRILWAYQLDDAVRGNPAVEENGVYVACVDRSLYKLDPDSGALIWRLRLSSPLEEGPRVAGQIVYQFSLDEGMSAIDAATGTRKWVHSTAREFVARSKDRVALFTNDRELQLLDAGSGEVIESLDLSPANLTVSNTVDDAIYAMDRSGHVRCFRMEQTPYLRKQQVQAATEQLSKAKTESPESKRLPQSVSPKEDESTTDPFRSRRDKKP